MLDKKRVGFVLLVSLFMINFVFADPLNTAANVGDWETDVAGNVAEGTRDVMVGLGGYFKEVLSPFFGDTELLSRVFLAIMLGLLIYNAVGTLFESSNRIMKFGLTFAVTALALLGIPSNFLLAIRTQYGAMGAALLSFVTFFFIILWYSIKSESLLLARIIWIFYFFYYMPLPLQDN
jgi:hypothetical protein